MSDPRVFYGYERQVGGEHDGLQTVQFSVDLSGCPEDRSADICAAITRAILNVLDVASEEG
jgi:hypothetical protein